MADAVDGDRDRPADPVGGRCCEPVSCDLVNVTKPENFYFLLKIPRDFLFTVGILLDLFPKL